MDQIHAHKTELRQRAVLALRQALEVASPGIELDAKGYTTSHADNLVPAVTPTDFEADLGQGRDTPPGFRRDSTIRGLGRRASVVRLAGNGHLLRPPTHG